MNYKAYTGIGSRDTPYHILDLMTRIARYLSDLGYVLRSGAADGADTAFEKGASRKEIYLPWKGFNQRHGDCYKHKLNEFSWDIASKYHPRFFELTDTAKKLIQRNTYQVLGNYGKNDEVRKSKFVICYTKDGKASGGTGQAIRIAEDYKIPVFNLYYEEVQKRFNKAITIHMDNNIRRGR